MAYYFKTWHTEITEAIADAEPMDQRLFAEQENAECGDIQQRNTPAPKDGRLVQLGLPLSSVPCLSKSDLISFTALKRH